MAKRLSFVVSLQRPVAACFRTSASSARRRIPKGRHCAARRAIARVASLFYRQPPVLSSRYPAMTERSHLALPFCRGNPRTASIAGFGWPCCKGG